jgi:hypothetical protein
MSHKFRERQTRAIAVALLCFCLLSVTPNYLRALGVEYEGGMIERIVDDRIYVKGEMGDHIFEIIGVCSWCEEGLEVSIAFKGYTRATLQPKSPSFQGRPLQVLIIRDGRE